MTHTLSALADRLVGLVAPKATVQAACNESYTKFCYCSGARYYARNCTRTGANCTESCGSCTYRGLGCA